MRCDTEPMTVWRYTKSETRGSVKVYHPMASIHIITDGYWIKSDKPIRHILIKRGVRMKGFKMTEEKVRKLLPVVESILSREYGRKITLKDLSVGGITVYKKDCAK